MIFPLIVASLVCILAVSGDDLPAARILLYKSTITNPVVEGKNFDIIYQIINNGDTSATKIEIVDRYDPNSFEIMTETKEDGSIFMAVEEVPPGGQTTLNVTVIPKLYGVYESTRAKIKYFNDALGDSEDSADGRLRNGYSTSLGRIRIVSAIENLRATSYYFKDWIYFVGLYSVAIVIPFLIWWSTKSSNEQNSKKKNI